MFTGGVRQGLSVWAWRLFGLAALLVVLTACGGAGGGSGSQGEKFPSKQMEIIVPWDPGGGTDQTARQLASAAEDTCGTNITVSNQTGSTGAVGFKAAADAKPDGYTIGLATVEIAMINHLGIAQITPKDVQGVMQYNFDPASVTVSSDSKYKTIKDFLDATKSGQPIRVGTSGTGSIWHIAAAGMAKQVGGKITNVPFDGAAPAIQAVLGGQIEATTASGAEVASQVQAGKLRPLATMGEDRIDILPNTPTLKEEGINWTSGAWRGLVVPKGTPKKRVQKLNTCFKKAYDSKKFQQFMKKNGFGMVYKPADEFNQYMNQEFKRYDGIISSLNLKQQ